MLKLAEMERCLRLRHQLRLAFQSQPKAAILHLSHAGGATDPAKAIREKAFLMQLRLHLEAQTETGTRT
jgi:hypothetical protein